MMDKWEQVALEVCKDAEDTGRMHAGYLWHKIAAALRQCEADTIRRCADACKYLTDVDTQSSILALLPKEVGE